MENPSKIARVQIQTNLHFSSSTVFYPKKIQDYFVLVNTVFIFLAFLQYLKDAYILKGRVIKSIYPTLLFLTISIFCGFPPF